MPIQRYHQRLKVRSGEQWNVNRSNFTGTLGWDDQTKRGQDSTRIAGMQAMEGVKHHGSGDVWFDTGPAALPSASPGRKAASAMIAKIPLVLARHIAATYLP